MFFSLHDLNGANKKTTYEEEDKGSGKGGRWLRDRSAPGLRDETLSRLDTDTRKGEGEGKRRVGR